MKTIIIYSFFTIILIALLSSCKKDDIVADPDGTITLTLNASAGWIIYQGLDPNPIVSHMPHIFFHFGMDPSTLNSLGTINYCPSPISGSGCGQIYSAFDVANLGKVSGLGNVTIKPSSGYAPTCAIQKGYGYVIRYRKTHDQSNTTFPYYYARFYVVDWLTSATTGGVIGATVKYQNPF
ncbi:MAG: DUF5036 family protein [Bacteroidota bacterium]